MSGNIERHEQIAYDPEAGYTRRKRVVQNVNAQRKLVIARVTQLVWLLFSVLEVLIALRILLKLLAANAASGFAGFIYGLSEPFLIPFTGLFPTPQVEGAVVELSSLVALLVYGLLAFIIVRLIWLLFYHPSTRTVATEEKQRT